MRFKRFLALAAAAVMTAGSAYTLQPVSAVSDDSLADFSEKWADKFFEGYQTEISDNTYKSHDLNIRIDRYQTNRMTGDVDENGVVEIADVVLALRYQAEDAVSISSTGLMNADVDEDEMFTASDTAQMMCWLSGSITDEEFFVNHKLVWFVIDFYIRNMENFRGAFAQGTYPENNKQVDSIENMANQNNAMFAINCDYCGFRKNGVIIRNGVTYQSAYRGDICVLYKNGVMDIVRHTDYLNMSDDEKSQIWQSVSFAPALVMDGEVNKNLKRERVRDTVNNLHPRSGIGYFEPGHYCFIQVEGRQPDYSIGIYYPEYAQMFKDLGCVEAFNMDGGSSSVIAFDGKQYNKPAWSGRKTSDILYLVDSADILPDTAAAAWLEKQATEEE